MGRRVAAGWTLCRLALLAILGAVFLAGDAEAQRKRRRRTAANADASNFYSGATPSGATKWKADSAGSIYTVVDTSHLKFDRVPKYFCTVVPDARKLPLGVGVNATLIDLMEASPLTNVTGKNTPVGPSNTGFRVRLRFKPEVGRNLTESTARLGNWRVRWSAITEGHSLVEAARADVQNDRYDSGIDEKPVGSSLGYVKLLESLAKEEPAVVKAIVGLDYELPVSLRPKPKKPKAEKASEDKAESTKSEGEAAATAEGDAASDAAGDDSAKEQEASA